MGDRRGRSWHGDSTQLGIRAVLHRSLQTFRSKVEVARLREENERQDGRRNAITLHKGGGVSVVLAIKEGNRLEEHPAPGPIALSVCEGLVRFTAEGEAIEAEPETVLTSDAKVRHTLEALSDAVCLLNVVTGG